LPPSVVRNTPRSSFLENRCPIAATYTTSGVLRVDDDAGDVMGVGETHELPGRAGVDGLEDALP
jgi:hypothetical protein